MTNEILVESEDKLPTVHAYYVMRVQMTSDIKPSWLTETIGLTPSWTTTAGEAYTSRRPDGMGGRKEVVAYRSSSVWGLTTKQILSTHDLNSHCEYLASLLEPKRIILRALKDQPDSLAIGFRIWADTETYMFGDSIDSKYLSLFAEISHTFNITVFYRGPLAEESYRDE